MPFFDPDERPLFYFAGYNDNADRIRHENTTTSRNTREIENALSAKLDKIMNKLRHSPAANDVPALRREFAQEVEDTVTAATQQIYLQGVNYVQKYNESPVLVNERDIAEIRRLGVRYVESFWRRVTDAVQRNTVLLQENGYAPRTELNTTAIFATIAATVATNALAQATVNKAQELPRWSNVDIVWITALDDRVCPICRPLHNKTWKMNDPNLLLPPHDAHINCRCRLLFKDTGEIFVG